MELLFDLTQVDVIIDGPKSTVHITDHRNGERWCSYKNGRDLVQVYKRSDGLYEIHSEFHRSVYNGQYEITDPKIIETVEDNDIKTKTIKKKRLSFSKSFPYIYLEKKEFEEKYIPPYDWYQLKEKSYGTIAVKNITVDLVYYNKNYKKTSA